MPSRAASADGNRSPRDVWAFSRAMTAAPLDLIFFPTVYTFVPILRRVKTVVGIHDIIAEKFPQYTFKSRRAQMLWRLKIWLALRQATRLLTVSEHARTGIQDYFKIDPQKIRVTHEAPARTFRPISDRGAIRAAQRRVGVDPDGRTIIYLGGISPHKNLKMLVNVFAQLLEEERFADVRLLIIGDIADDPFFSDYRSVRAQVDAECPGGVVFTGYLDDEVVACLLNGATACVMPSWDEGFGLPGIEAAACGAPVVATRSSALPEILGDAALYIDPASPDELYAALAQVLQDSDLRHTMSEHGIARAGKLSWESAARCVIKVFEELA